MSRFDVGDTVYMGRGKFLRKLTVKRVIDNHFLPVYQYAFEEIGSACGEQSIREEADGRDYRISECYKEQYEENIECSLNTMANGMGMSIDDNLSSKLMNLFFKPDLIFVKWLIAYAGDRMIIDVGAGQGHLVRLIKRMGGKAIGLEPNINYTEVIKKRMLRHGDYDVNEILPFTVERAAKLINDIGGEKAMLVFARPCHSDFVEEGIDLMPEGMEALYITVPENLNKYDDLGAYTDYAEFVEHKGVSEDDEVVYSIKK